MKKLLFLGFLPRSTDLALLILRLVFGVGMVWLHGRGKLMDFSNLKVSFPDPLSVGHSTSLILDLMGEVVCASLIALGAFTRLAAVGGMITMGVAFFLVHKTQLSGPNSGEMALLYLSAYATIFFAGAGRYSVDARLGAPA